MDVRVSIDATKLLRDLPKYERAVSYEVVGATNRTLDRVGAAVEKRVDDRFIIRNRKFWFGLPGRLGDGFAARITRASVGKNRPWGEVAIGETSKGGPFLGPRFERGGVKKPTTPGAKRVAAPITGRPARPSIARGIDPRFTFAGMKLTAFRGKKKLRRKRKGRTVDQGLLGEFGRAQIDQPVGAVQWKGKERTFLLPRGVVQRIGPDRDDYRTIWSFIAPPSIPADLRWEETAEREARRWFAEELDRGISSALTRVRSGR
jgi:hypothetical protein